MIGVRHKGWAKADIEFYLAVKREQERRFPLGRLVSYDLKTLLIDGPGYFAPQRVEMESK